MSITDKTPVKLPLSVWFSAVLAAAAAGGWAFSMKEDVARQGIAIDANAEKAEQKDRALWSELRAQREVLIRVDENVKELKRRGP